MANQLEKAVSLEEFGLDKTDCDLVERTLSLAIGLFDDPEQLIADIGMDKVDAIEEPLTQAAGNDLAADNVNIESPSRSAPKSPPRDDPDSNVDELLGEPENAIESVDMFATEEQLGTQIPDDEISLNDEEKMTDDEIPSSGTTATPEDSKCTVQSLGKRYGVDDPDKRFCSVEALRNAPEVII